MAEEGKAKLRLEIAGAPLTPALLRLDPMFDPLRMNSRFQKLVEPKP